MEDDRDLYHLVSNAHQRLVEGSGRTGPGPARSDDELVLRLAINRWDDLEAEDKETAVTLARRVLSVGVLVEVGAGDEEFTAAEASTLIAALDQARRLADGLEGIVYRSQPSPLERLANLLREAVQALPVPQGCTGYRDEVGLVSHDGDTCPVHELGEDD